MADEVAVNRGGLEAKWRAVFAKYVASWGSRLEMHVPSTRHRRRLRPLGLDRWLDFSVYHAGGMDTLTGATRWQVSSEDEEDYMAEDLFLVRDHLGSVVMTLKAKKVCTMYGEPPNPVEDPPCLASAYVLNPIETFEYDPDGQPTAHVPASESTPQGPGYLALKTAGAFAMSGEKSGYMLLDRNDIGRPNGTPGNTWVRNRAVPAAQSHYGWNYLFTARPWDSDVRQYYVRNRWYDPLQGRWTAVDPIGYKGGLNQYAYCGGNPVHWNDVLGLAYFVLNVRRCFPSSNWPPVWPESGGSGLPGEVYVWGHVGYSLYGDDGDLLGSWGQHAGTSGFHDETQSPEFYTDSRMTHISDELAEQLREEFEKRLRDQDWNYDLTSNNCTDMSADILNRVAAEKNAEGSPDGTPPIPPIQKSDYHKPLDDSSKGKPDTPNWNGIPDDNGKATGVFPFQTGSFSNPNALLNAVDNRRSFTWPVAPNAVGPMPQKRVK